MICPDMSDEYKEISIPTEKLKKKFNVNYYCDHSFMNTLIISTFSCTFEEFEKEITENFFCWLVKDYTSDYEFVKVNYHKAHTFINITDRDKFGASLESDEAKEFDKRNNCKDTVYTLDLIE